jgi:hypothetical protein
MLWVKLYKAHQKEQRPLTFFSAHIYPSIDNKEEACLSLYKSLCI